MMALTEIAKTKLRRRLMWLLLFSGGFAAYCAADIYSYYTYGRFEDLFRWLIYNVIALSMNMAPVQYPATFPVLSIVFLACISTCTIYSVLRTRQAIRILEKYDKEEGGHPVLQLLRVGLFKEAVDLYFDEGRSYECANFLYGAFLRNPPLLRHVWQIVSSRLQGKSLVEEAEKLLLISEDAPREIRMQIRDMLIEGGVYEVGSPEEAEWLERAIREEEEENKCIICGKKLGVDDEHLICPFCFGKACKEHLHDYFEKEEKCPKCKMPIKKYFI
ncbi:MAG: hypothetical protein ACTSWP_06755 [Candidatus Freyarchaeota archaeon]